MLVSAVSADTCNLAISRQGCRERYAEGACLAMSRMAVTALVCVYNLHSRNCGFRMLVFKIASTLSSVSDNNAANLPRRRRIQPSADKESLSFSGRPFRPAPNATVMVPQFGG